MSEATGYKSAIGVFETGIRRAAVIGAGTMGSGIAAQFANAGVPVDLLDIPAEPGRLGPALAGIARQLKAGGFMTPAAARLVRAGSIEDDFARVADADWIVEAVIENPDIKRRIYQRLDAIRKPGSIVSSNTSTIPRSVLLDGASDAFRRDFVITHFFNPPRTMELLELVTAAETSPKVTATVRAAARNVLGKTVIACRDTPGFVANRIGCYWIAVAILEAARMGLTIEQADAVQTALGVPRTGVFGLMDLIGIDLIPGVWGGLAAALPADDALHAHDLCNWGVTMELIEAGAFGRKTGAGFYRKSKDGSRDVLDLETGQYRALRPFDLTGMPGGGRDLAALINDASPLGRYAATVLARLVAYATTHGPDIAERPGDIDTAMELGYSWRDGPLKLASQAGIDAVRTHIADLGLPVPAMLAENTVPSSEAAAMPMALPALLVGADKLAGNPGASLYDLGDGLAVFQVHRKMNSMHPDVFDILEEALSRAGRQFGALVLASASPRSLSAGADLTFFKEAIDQHDFETLKAFVQRGQQLFLGMKYAPVPVVAAVRGVALGGGCEFIMHADMVVAHTEARIGLPEAGLGLLPGWGGCTQTLLRMQERAKPGGPFSVASSAFDLVRDSFVSGSAPDAREHGLLRPKDSIVMHHGDVLADAQARARELSQSYTPPQKAMLTVSGHSGWLGLMSTVQGNVAAGRLSETDSRISGFIAQVMTGGPDGDQSRLQTEEDLMRIECEALVELTRSPETAARITHFIETRKPLRN